MKKIIYILLCACIISPQLMAQTEVEVLEQQIKMYDDLEMEQHEKYEEFMQQIRDIKDSDDDEETQQAQIDKINDLADIVNQKIDSLQTIKWALMEKVGQLENERVKTEANEYFARVEQYEWPELNLDRKVSPSDNMFYFTVNFKDANGKIQTSENLEKNPAITDKFRVEIKGATTTGDNIYQLWNTRDLSDKHISVTLFSKEEPDLYKEYQFPIDFSESYVNNSLYRPAQGTITINQSLRNLVLIREVKDHLTKKTLYEIAFAGAHHGQYTYYIVEKGSTLTINIESVNSDLDWDTATSVYTDKKMNWEEVVIINHTGLKNGQYSIVEELVDPKVKPLRSYCDFDNAKPYSTVK